MNVLHIDSSILEGGSITRDLSAAVVARIRADYPGAVVQYRDVASHEIKHLTGAIAAGFRPTGVAATDEAVMLEHQISELLVTEFLSSDVIVVGAPMYNFSVPSQLKAWLDRLAQAGRTFQYTATGPIGLAGNKRVIVVSARGGFYLEGPLAPLDFQETYLKAFFGFLGITDVRFVRAEGASKGEQVRNTGIAAATASISQVLVGIQTPAESASA
ncbi:FMN-dependent NADH-azoreductase [Pigmentiphaga aceris]|uniref:FMN dependent NADH:quinone oxidoreductase n=1 Tax=Pigmentiphaga aceris TaxID=1940612 RepID=A0A5C0AY17_9BURK|nr:NAD(P)H-dependent oxidoreductase [Pigmentiphaga aceris]QEI06464.1 FMN-dependent NADH-azoreductase [Pigmentiphaga aceris]